MSLSGFVPPNFLAREFFIGIRCSHAPGEGRTPVLCTGIVECAGEVHARPDRYPLGSPYANVARSRNIPIEQSSRIVFGDATGASCLTPVASDDCR